MEVAIVLAVYIYINKKVKSVIFHLFAQKPPVDGFSPNLVYGVVSRT